MASVLKFKTTLVDLQEEIKRRDDLAEATRREKFIAARRIQAWFRGILTRNHLCKLHERATTIQRHWRGYNVRIGVERYLIERVHQMWQDYYDRMAIRIQAVWRGYWIRKTRLNLRKVKQWLNTVYAKNEETLENMRKFRQREIEHARKVMEQDSMVWILFILFKLHHLLRTKRRPGVLTRIDKTHFTVIEEMLKCLEYYLYVPKREVTREDCEIDPKPSLVFRGTYYERCEREIREFERSLDAGNVPIFRSQPYDEQEKLRKLNYLYRDTSKQNRCEMKFPVRVAPVEKGAGEDCRSNEITYQPTRRSIRQNTSCSTGSALDSVYIEPDKLYDEIRKMDCRLNRLRIKCPIHDLAYSTCTGNTSTF